MPWACASSSILRCWGQRGAAATPSTGCATSSRRENFDSGADDGQALIFRVRENESDFTFLNTFVDQDFVTANRLFVADKRLNRGRMVWEYLVKSRKAKDYRQMLLDGLYHPPSIAVGEEQGRSNGSLYLVHRFEGKPLVKEFIANTMLGIEYLWGGRSSSRPARSSRSIRRWRRDSRGRWNGPGFSTPWTIANFRAGTSSGSRRGQGRIAMMDNIRQALQNLGRNLSEQGQSAPIPFGEFLALLIKRPERVVRNVFQVFHDMVMSYVGDGVDEYPDDPESIHFVFYNFDRLFIEGSDHPFFADRLFANRLMNLVEAWKRGAQQNKIYIFEGPHGSGKSTFLNNLLLKFEQYANTEEGTTYETVWRLDRRTLASFPIGETNHFLEKLSHLLDEYEFDQKDLAEAKNVLQGGEDYVEVPCPSHDHPLLVIPKEHRRRFLDDLFAQAPEKRALLAEKEYEWVFGNHACTICSSLYQALLNRLKSPEKVFSMLYAQPYRYNRRLGEGISVFNPGDRPLKETALGNPILQERINSLLRDSNQVNYIFSRYAKINNGIYALMDVKSHNVERLIGLHNIISEGMHKVEDIEENVTSLFLAVMNPEDAPTSRASSPSSTASSTSRSPTSSTSTPRWRSTARSSAPTSTRAFCRGCCTTSPG